MESTIKKKTLQKQQIIVLGVLMVVFFNEISLQGAIAFRKPCVRCYL